MVSNRCRVFLIKWQVAAVLGRLVAGALVRPVAEVAKFIEVSCDVEDARRPEGAPCLFGLGLFSYFSEQGNRA